MANSLSPEEFNAALCDVRKAHRLIYTYQSKMLDLIHFIKSKLDFPEFGGNKLFSDPIAKKRSSYDDLKIFKGMWPWDFIYSYAFEYYLGSKTIKKSVIALSILQVSDTGYFDSKKDKHRTDISVFESEVEAKSKLIFLLEKKDKKNNYAWDKEWVDEKIISNDKVMSADHHRECRNDNKNIQIIYSFSLEKFLDENTTIETLTEFTEYCNDQGISELNMI